jgi:hypothetical protein
VLIGPTQFEWAMMKVYTTMFALVSKRSEGARHAPNQQGMKIFYWILSASEKVFTSDRKAAKLQVQVPCEYLQYILYNPEIRIFDG